MALNKSVVIFGGGGQDGVFLNKLLVSQGYEVLPFTHKGGEIGPPLDVSAFDRVEAVIQKHHPNIVFHLAAKSSTSHEFILENHRTIVDGTLAIMEAVDRHCPNTKVFLASSALVFKNEGHPISEEHELESDSAYAMARLEALQIARYYRHRGRQVYVGFLFNHESHLRPPHSVVRKIVKGVVDIHLSMQSSLSIGNPDVVKEWMWPGDAVAAMLILINQDDIFEACIGDGIGRSVRDYAIACSDVVGISLDNCLVEIPGYKAEYQALVSDPGRIKSLGWTPKVTMQDLAKRMVEHEINCRG